MADFTKFRTALNGFNRADVSSYIESTAAQYQKDLEEANQGRQELEEQLSALQQERDRLQIKLDAKARAQEQLQLELEQTRKDLDEQTAMANDLLQQLDETETALKATEDALEEALTPDPPTAEKAEAQEAQAEPADYAAMELEAYRRAEAMERLAAERTAKMRQELDMVLEQVSARYAETGQEIQVLTEDIRTNLQRLQESMSDLDVIFDETTGRFEDLEDLEDA